VFFFDEDHFWVFVLGYEPNIPAVKVAVAPRGEFLRLDAGEELTHDVPLLIEHPE
jgi:hypothetical protein